MTEKMFPHRQRCKTCSKKLGEAGAPVWLGLYDSARCALIADPVREAVDAPRECRTQRDGRWAFKRRYRFTGEIPGRIHDDPSISHYSCGHCGHWHVGHSRIGEAETFRMFTEVTDIGDFLLKRRGRATRKQVAEAAGVRPIRLKELEEGIDHAQNLVTLFKVFAVLGSRPGVAMRGGR